MRTCPRCNKSKPPKEFYGTYLYCKECKREEGRKRYAPKKEALRLRRLSVYDKRGWKLCKKCRKYKSVKRYSAHPTHWDRLSHVCTTCHNKDKKRYVQAPENKTKAKERGRVWYEKNRRKKLRQNAQWRKDNPEKSHAIWRNYMDRRKNAEGTHTKREWLAIRDFYSPNSICIACGSKKALERDHVHPLEQGGSDYPANLQPLCKSCNGKKGCVLTIDYRPDKGAYAASITS